MNCTDIAATLGFDCVPLDDAGTVAMFATPFKFADGDPMPVFVQERGGTVRFFDDGDVFMHFTGRGVRMDTRKQAAFITKAAQRHGASFSTDWVLEAVVTNNSTADAFQRYMRSLLAIGAWELENEGVSTDTTLVIEEAIMALRERDKDAEIVPEPVFRGISGKKRTLAFSYNGTGVAVTTTHHASVSAALMSMMDIRQLPENSVRDFMFIIEDAEDTARAKADALIMQAVARVQLMSNLRTRTTALQ